MLMTRIWTCLSSFTAREFPTTNALTQQISSAGYGKMSAVVLQRVHPIGSLSRNSLTRAVAGLLKRRPELRACRGLVMEAEDPRREKTQRKQDEALARISRFCTLAEMNGLTLRILDFEYKQPKLSLEELDGSEHPMLLLSARTRSELVPTSYRHEAEELLEFIYTKVYPEGYSTDVEESVSYRRYCEALLEREKRALPERVRSLGSTQPAALLGKRKRAKRAESTC